MNIHPENPERRRIAEVVEVLRGGGLIVYPTDSCYAFGFQLDNRAAVREVQRLRKTDRTHNFTMVCRDLSEIASYARVDNWHYRMLKAHTPGPYTFILAANRRVPRPMVNERRKTIGIRVPDHPIPLAMLEELGEPLMSSTLSLPGDDLPLTEPIEMLDRLKGSVDLIVDGGACGIEPTTVVDLTADYPQVLRHGKGASTDFE